MILYFIRHGHPIYEPDSLTETGIKQAEALKKRFLLYGLDEIYSSTSIRAQMTAEPTCKALNLEKKLLDWAHEHYAFEEFSTVIDGVKDWIWRHEEPKRVLLSPEIRALDDKWYEHEYFKDYPLLKSGLERVNANSDAFLESLGFKHDRENYCFRKIKTNNKRIAFFAHEGLGKLFMSNVLDIPYPILSTRYEFGHSSVSVIYFDESKEIVYPKILQWSNDSHLFKENFLTGFQNLIDI